MPSSPLRTWCELVRLPNVFTIVADVLMGYLFVHHGLTPVRLFAALLAASICLYWGGMILNDWFDETVDRRLRPERPLPSGRISPAAAAVAGWGLLAVGLMLAGGLSLTIRESLGWWRPGAIAMILAVCIVLYDGPLKRTVLAPLVMGGCRALNILFAMSTGAFVAEGPGIGFDMASLCVAVGMGLFVTGITLFARNESEKTLVVDSDRTAAVTDGETKDPRITLGTGMIVMAAGLLLLATFPRLSPFSDGMRSLAIQPPYVWPVLMLLLGGSVLRRCGATLWTPTCPRIQLAVKQCLVSLIVFDAAICLAVRTPAWWAVGIVCLIIPMIGWGRWFPST